LVAPRIVSAARAGDIRLIGYSDLAENSGDTTLSDSFFESK